MIQLLCAHAVAAVLAPLLVKMLGRKAFGVLALVPAAGLGGKALSDISACFQHFTIRSPGEA